MSRSASCRNPEGPLSSQKLHAIAFISIVSIRFRVSTRPEINEVRGRDMPDCVEYIEGSTKGSSRDVSLCRSDGDRGTS